MIAEKLISTEQDDMMIKEDVENEQKTEEADEVNVLDELMQKAIDRGYLITDDLMAAFPEAENNMAQLEEIFIQLVNQGIEVYADAEEAEEEKRLKDQSTDEAQIPATDYTGFSGRCLFPKTM